MGAILIPELGLDHFESLQHTSWHRKYKTHIDTYLIAALTRSACERQTTKISCTPASAKLSKVQSSSDALHIGSKHCDVGG
jgi:hypothetical protein